MRSSISLMPEQTPQQKSGTQRKTTKLHGVYFILQEAASSVRVFKDRLDFICDGFTMAFSSSGIKNGDITRLEKSLKGWLTVDPQRVKLLENQGFLSAIREDDEHCTIPDLLLNHGLDISVRGENEESLFHVSVSSQSQAAVLIHHLSRQSDVDLNIDARDSYGRTPLHHAV